MDNNSRDTVFKQLESAARRHVCELGLTTLNEACKIKVNTGLSAEGVSNALLHVKYRQASSTIGWSVGSDGLRLTGRESKAEVTLRRATAHVAELGLAWFGLSFLALKRPYLARISVPVLKKADVTLIRKREQAKQAVINALQTSNLRYNVTVAPVVRVAEIYGTAAIKVDGVDNTYLWLHDENLNNGEGWLVGCYHSDAIAKQDRHLTIIGDFLRGYLQ